MQEYVRDPSYYSTNKDRNEFKFKRVEVEHMAGIVPLKEKTSEREQKNKVLRYNENAIEIYNDTSLHSIYLYLDDNDVDYSFFKEQYDFLLSLNEEDREVLSVYTMNDGYKVLGVFRKYSDRNTIAKELDKYHPILDRLSQIFGMIYQGPFHTTSEWNFNTPEQKENYERSYEIGKKYYDTMKRIMKKAPPLKKQIRVFRGLKKEYGKYNSPYDFSGFVSTSYSPEVAATFTQQVENSYPPVHCCMFDILVKPGIKAIWISPISTFHTLYNNPDKSKKSREYTEREILLYCDENVYTSFSRQSTKQILKFGSINKEVTLTKRGDTIYKTYDTFVVPNSDSIKLNEEPEQPKPKLVRGVGKRRLNTTIKNKFLSSTPNFNLPPPNTTVFPSKNKVHSWNDTNPYYSFTPFSSNLTSGGTRKRRRANKIRNQRRYR